jgi:hydrogenase-4 component F
VVTPPTWGSFVTSRALLAGAIPVVPVLAAVVVAALPSQRIGQRVALGSGVVTLAMAVIAGAWTLSAPGRPLLGRWLVLDAAGAVLLGVVALAGALSLAVSPAYLATVKSSLFNGRRPVAHYYTALLVFWGALLAVPLAANLGAAWLLVEVTSAASALLVAYSGKARALEAAWKYLVLTSLGLGVALLGLVVLQVAQHSAGGPVGLSYMSLHAAAGGLDRDVTLVAYLLLLAGLAAKVGWAPVHNWLPDAHSEAPPPVSALLSAALLPSVLLVAWRVQQALAGAIGAHTSREVFVFFGLASLAVSVPFLWRPLAWKRLLAYSSLEHMGVIALGIGFGNPLALIGVIVHVAGHAVAKSVAFSAAIPLLGVQPSTASHPARGVARADAQLGSVVGGSLAVLAGLPPSPLFISEFFIALGGIRSGHTGAVAVAIILLALGFLGLAHALIDAVAGRRRGIRPGVPPGRTLIVALAAAGLVLLVALAAGALALPDSDIARALTRGLA